MPLKIMGSLQTGTPQPVEFAFYGFHTGLNVNPDLQLMADTDLVQGKDVYLRNDGGCQMRNGMNLFCSGAVPSANPAFIQRFYQDVQSGSVVTPETLKLLAVINGNLYTVTTSTYTLVGSVGGSGVTQATFARIQNPNDPHFSGGLTDCTVICTGVGGPYVYDSTNLYAPTGWAQASGAQWCAVVNGILWFGGIGAFPNQIFGTGDGVTVSMELLPGFRNFVMTSKVEGMTAQGTGANASLVVGLNVGWQVLYGTGPSTFYSQMIPFADGVTAGRTMVSDRGIVYALGHSAEFAFDGVSVPVQVSQKVAPWVLNDPFATGYPMVNNRNLSWSQVYANRLHLGYCANSATQPNTILCYDLVVHGWTVLVPGVGSGVASMCLLDASSDSNPYVALVGCNDGTIRTWDYVPTNTSNPAYDDAPTNSVAVLAIAQSKYFKTGPAGVSKMLTRFYPEILVTGVFNQPITVTSDQGAAMSQVILDNPLTPGTGTLVWDVGQWDVNTWGGAAFSNFGPPNTRADFNLQGESFSFGIAMNSASAPWVWVGGSGVAAIQGRT